MKIKSPKPHKFGMHTDLLDNIDIEWLIGRFDARGNLIENESEHEIDGVKCLIRIHDFFKKEFNSLVHLDFIFKLYYGYDYKKIQQALISHNPGKITTKTMVAVVLYEIIEIGN